MDRAKFYASLRARNSGVFGTSLAQGQVAGMEAMLDEGERRKLPLRHMAYILATAFHESAHTMQAVRETLASTDAARISWQEKTLLSRG